MSEPHIEEEHECQYIIPVEWQPGFKGKIKVTKLRCVCGEETDR